MKSCSIIMPCWIRNQELYDLTVATFESLQKTKDLKNIQFIVIDNGSPLGGDMLQKISDICIRNRKNIGYPAAVNQGIKLSQGELLCITNNDIRISSNWLKLAREVFEEGPKELGSLHYRMIDYNEPIKLGDKTWIEGRERWCNGSFFVVKREVFEKVGLFDEEYGLGGNYDDWDFFHRARHIFKYKTAFTIEACFQHKHSSTLAIIKDREERNQTGRERFKQKFGAYPEDIWMSLYPNQMKEDYYKFLRECVK